MSMGKKKAYSFKNRATLLICGAVVLFTLILTALFVTTLESAMRQSAEVSVEQAVSQVGKTVENYVNDLIYTARTFTDVYRLSDEAEFSKIPLMMDLTPEVSVVACYDKAGNIESICAQSGKTIKEHPLKNLSYKGFNAYRRDEFTISEPHVESLLEGAYPWVVSIARNIKDKNGNEKTVVLDVRFSNISGYIDGVGVGQHGYCFIMDDAGKIVYHPQQQLLHAGLKKENLNTFAAATKGTYADKQTIYNVTPLSNCAWRVVGVSYTEELVTARIKNTATILIFWLIIVGLTAVICSILLSKSISKPVNKLILAMRAFEKDAENFSYVPKGGSREVLSLSESFGHMVGRIQALMEKVRNEEITLRKTELKALQAQINPHFLYNTLDAISWMCESDRSQDAAQMVNALAKLFRISISKGHELIPIEKEIEHAKSYLMIEKFRYKDQFTYRFDVQESCLTYLCNKITLQPIIENAIYHGLNRMVDEGEILISIFEDGNDIIFKVADNGVGMSEEQVKHILKKEPGSKSGIGIKNVNDRIKIYFGEQYGLKVESEPDEGTTVTIRMPKIKEESDV